MSELTSAFTSTLCHSTPTPPVGHDRSAHYFSQSSRSLVTALTGSLYQVQTVARAGGFRSVVYVNYVGNRLLCLGLVSNKVCSVCKRVLRVRTFKGNCLILTDTEEIKLWFSVKVRVHSARLTSSLQPRANMDSWHMELFPQLRQMQRVLTDEIILILFNWCTTTLKFTQCNLETYVQRKK